jgi:hypothetical protein
MPLHVSSTVVLIIRRSKLYYTASGIVTPVDGCPVHRADNLTAFMCRLSWNLGTLTYWHPLDLSRPVMGLLYVYFRNMIVLRIFDDRFFKKKIYVWRQWLTCCATNRKVTGSIPAGVSGFVVDIKSFRSQYGPGVDSASNRNEYQEYFLGVKAAGA